MTDKHRRTHNLKVHPSQFEAILSGAKTWEFRKNDRDFAEGDFLKLNFWDPQPRGDGFGFRPVGYGKNTSHPDRSTIRRVEYIVHGGQFGIPVGYCIMTLGDKES